MLPKNPVESVDPPTQSTDYSQGYEIRIQVHPDRFTVTGPSPLPQAVPEEEGSELDLPSALKSVIAIVKAHPLDSDDTSYFDAGFKGE